MSPTRHCAIIGHPVAHSLSPAMHRAAYRALGLDWDYQAIDCPAGGLDAFIAGLDASWRGLSVTMPHKQALLRHGLSDEVAELVGGGNTLVLDHPRRVFNTDVTGFVRALASHEITGVGRATIAGAGATAAAGLVGLSRLGLHELLILVREPARAADLERLAHQLGVRTSVGRLGQDRAIGELVISALPGGVADAYLDELLAPGAAVVDVSYHPWPGLLASRAAAAGLPVVTGLDLLVGQAVDQVRHLTGQSVPAELLHAAALAELTSRQQQPPH